MGQLQCRPVQRSGRPGYPTKLQVLETPELLARYVPPAWLARADVAGALSAFLAVNTAGCAGKPAVGVPGTDPRLATAAIVAPIFEHGEGRGRGRFGTIRSANSFTAYLSEEDALQIIQAELRESGLDLAPRGEVLDSVTLRRHRRAEQCDWITERRQRETSVVEEPLEFDLSDLQRHIAVEFVGANDCDVSDRGDSVLSVKFKERAQDIRDSVEKCGRGVYFGAFYDPAARYGLEDILSNFGDPGELSLSEDEQGSRASQAVAKAEQAALEESKRLLREQVKDFVDWLKGQGVI